MARDTSKRFFVELRRAKSRHVTAIEHHSLIDRQVAGGVFNFTWFRQCVFENCRFEELDFNNSIFQYCKFRGCLFVDCKMDGITAFDVTEENSTYLRCDGSLTNDPLLLVL